MNDQKLLKCLTGGCDRIAQTRGICYRCYTRLLREIKKGKTTMSEAEQACRVHARKSSPEKWGYKQTMRRSQSGIRYGEGDK